MPPTRPTSARPASSRTGGRGRLGSACGGGHAQLGKAQVRAAGPAVLQEDAGLADVAQALLGVALEAALDQAAQLGRLLHGQGVPVGLGAQHGGQGVADGLALEELLAR